MNMFECDAAYHLIVDASSFSEGDGDQALGPSHSAEGTWLGSDIRVSPASDNREGPIQPVNRPCNLRFEAWIKPQVSEETIGILTSSVLEQSVALRGGEVAEPGVKGWLAVVGLGIRPAGQVTGEVRSVLGSTQRAVYATDPESPLNDAGFDAAILAINPEIPIIEPFDEGGSAADTPAATDRRLNEIIELAKLERVCLVTYGHPAVHYSLTRKAILKARETGVDAIMLPGISSLDCLFADMLVDPISHGLQVFDARGFLTLKRESDASISYAFMQPSLLNKGDLSLFKKKLTAVFPPDHECYLYRASPSLAAPDRIEFKLSKLTRTQIDPGFLLYIPAKDQPGIDEKQAKTFERRPPKK